MESLLALGALVLVCGAFVFASSWWSRRKARAPQSQGKRKLLIHSINDDRCTGCDACVTVCPTDVLELVGNKSRVQRFNDCIQCEQCVMVCPTTALIMHYEGTEPPPVRQPELDRYYQAAKGLYLIGEAAGKPLIKNASNLGRAVVEHMVKNGLKHYKSSRDTDVDVLIVGSGPGGLSAALSCIEHGLSYALLEKDELVASTIARYPKGKDIMAEPYDVRCVGHLPVWDAGKDELLAAWHALLDETGVKVSTREQVEEVQYQGKLYAVRSNRQSYRAQRLVLSIGTRGKPRRLGVQGEGLAKVSALLTDADHHRGQRVLVVGGGDSAVEAAIALAETAAHVTLSYRGKVLSRCKAKNRQRLDELMKEGRIEARFSSVVAEIRETTVVLKIGAEQKEIRNDHVFVCIGGDAPVKWLEALGVRFTEQPHMAMREPTDKVVESLVGSVAETERRQKANVIDLQSYRQLAPVDNGEKTVRRKQRTMH